MLIDSNVCIAGLVSHQCLILSLQLDGASHCSWLIKICVFPGHTATFSRLPCSSVWPFDWITSHGMWVDVANGSLIYMLFHLILSSKWWIGTSSGRPEKRCLEDGTSFGWSHEQNHGTEHLTVTWAMSKIILFQCVEPLKFWGLLQQLTLSWPIQGFLLSMFWRPWILLLDSFQFVMEIWCPCSDAHFTHYCRSLIFAQRAAMFLGRNKIIV